MVTPWNCAHARSVAPSVSALNAAARIAARYLPDSEARQAYPYEYDFEVVYRFEEKSLTVELRLRNNDTRPIPWSPGHHFYFNLPWIPDTSAPSTSTACFISSSPRRA